MSIYKLPTDTWLINKLISDSNNIADIIKKKKENKVIIKLSIKSNNEYKIYKLLEKLNHNPNIPRIFGVISCYEKNDILKDNLKSLKNKGLCYGKKNEDSTKIYFSIIEYITNGKTLTEISDNKFSRKQILSLLLQGLFTIYHYFYVFGIVHNDFNESNILIAHCEKDILEYKFITSPYRYFKFELFDDNWNQCQHKNEVKTHGLQLYFIDYDQSNIYHKYFITVDKVTNHPLENAFKFINTICKFCKYKDLDIFKICKDHYDSRGKHLINHSQQFIDAYNNDKTDEKNCFMIDRVRITLRMWIRELFKKIPGMKDQDYYIC